MIKITNPNGFGDGTKYIRVNKDKIQAVSITGKITPLTMPFEEVIRFLHENKWLIVGDDYYGK